MRLLIITQKIDQNDSYFGFFHEWLQKFAERCDAIVAVGLEVHDYKLPQNVTVLSLGKEHGRSRLKYLFRFYRYVWQYRREYDAVFAHMSPFYIIFGAPLWRLWHKRAALWYIHRSVDLKLKIAERLTDIVFTASPESFRISSRKVHYMGQAVDTVKYARPSGVPRYPVFTVVTVGRITPIKNLDTLLEAVRILIEENESLHVLIIGAPVLSTDHEYERQLRSFVATHQLGEVVQFVGSVPNKDIANYYWQSHVSINLCPTGGLDKAVLESMAAGLPVLVSNIAFREYLEPYAEELLFEERNAHDLARKLKALLSHRDREDIEHFLVDEVGRCASLSHLIDQIVTILQTV